MPGVSLNNTPLEELMAVLTPAERSALESQSAEARDDFSEYKHYRSLRASADDEKMEEAKSLIALHSAVERLGAKAKDLATRSTAIVSAIGFAGLILLVFYLTSIIGLVGFGVGIVLLLVGGYIYAMMAVMPVKKEVEELFTQAEIPPFFTEYLSESGHASYATNQIATFAFLAPANADVKTPETV